MSSTEVGATSPAKPQGSEAQRAARNISALMSASIVSKGALFAWQLTLSLWLGPQEYGIYGTVGGLMANAAALASFSMGLIVIRDVARAPQRAGAYWTAMLYSQTLLALLAYVGMNSLSIAYSDTLRAFAALAGLNLLIDIFGNMGHDLLLSRERMVVTSAVEIAHICRSHRSGAAGIDGGLGAAGRISGGDSLWHLALGSVGRLESARGRRAGLPAGQGFSASSAD